MIFGKTINIKLIYLLAFFTVRASKIRNLGTRIFVKPNNMFAYTIVYLTFSAPQILVRARVHLNVYLALHLPQR